MLLLLLLLQLLHPRIKDHFANAAAAPPHVKGTRRLQGKRVKARKGGGGGTVVARCHGQDVQQRGHQLGVELRRNRLAKE